METKMAVPRDSASIVRNNTAHTVCLLSCPSLWFSGPSCIDPLLREQSNHPLRYTFLQIFLDVFDSPDEIRSSLPLRVPQTSSSPSALKLSTETLGIMPLTGTFFWKQKWKICYILFFSFSFEPTVGQGESYFELISQKQPCHITLGMYIFLMVHITL